MGTNYILAQAKDNNKKIFLQKCYNPSFHYTTKKPLQSFGVVGLQILQNDGPDAPLAPLP